MVRPLRLSYQHEHAEILIDDDSVSEITISVEAGVGPGGLGRRVGASSVAGFLVFEVSEHRASRGQEEHDKGKGE